MIAILRTRQLSNKFIMDNPFLYHTYYGDDSPQFSGLFDNIIQGINAGLNVFKSIGGASGAGGGASFACGQSQAKGSAKIQQCSNQVLQALDQILAQVQNPNNQIPAQQAIASAQQLANSLSDSTYFYQAKHGDDANILANAKSQAQQKVLAITQAVNTAISNPLPSGSVAVTSGLNSIGTILNSPLAVYGALAVLAYVFVKRATK